MPSSPETRYFENSSDQNNNNVRLLLVRKNKRLKTKVGNRKLVNDKLLSALSKLALKIEQDIKTKKVLTLNNT